MRILIAVLGTMIAVAANAAELQWTASQCGTPPEDCVSGMTGYEVWASYGGSTYVIEGTVPATSGVNSFGPVDPTGVYVVRLMAQDGRVSAWSEPSVPPPPPLPAPGTEDILRPGVPYILLPAP